MLPSIHDIVTPCHTRTQRTTGWPGNPQLPSLYTAPSQIPTQYHTDTTHICFPKSLALRQTTVPPHRGNGVHTSTSLASATHMQINIHMAPTHSSNHIQTAETQYYTTITASSSTAATLGSPHPPHLSISWMPLLPPHPLLAYSGLPLTAGQL